MAYTRKQYKGNVSYTDTLASGIGSTDLSFSLKDGTTFPDGTVGAFVVTLDQGSATEEKILCTSRTGPTFTVTTRGYDGTVAVAHSVGASAVHTISAVDLDEANQLVKAILTGGTTGQVATVDTTLTPPIKLAAIPAAATTVTGPDAFGAASAVGVDTTYAREDHNHGLPAAPAAALTTASGTLGANQTVTANTLTTLFSTPVLAVGTWLINSGVVAGSSTASTEITIALGSATATFTGQRSSSMNAYGVANGEMSGSLTCLVTITAAGTLNLQCESTGSNTILASTAAYAFPGATGYTAVKVA